MFQKSVRFKKLYDFFQNIKEDTVSMLLYLFILPAHYNTDDIFWQK